MNIALLSADDLCIISSCFLFSGEVALAERALRDELCFMRTYSKKDIIYDVNAYHREIGLILEGTVEVSKQSPEGGRFVMNVLSAESLFGAAALFNDAAEYVTRLTAKTECRIVFFSQELMRKLMRENHAVAENYIAFLSDRIHFLNDKISGLLVGSTGGALRRWLRENARGADGKVSVYLSMGMSGLAGRLNMGRASLYRSFDELEDAGIIKRNGRDVTILCPEKLI